MHKFGQVVGLSNRIRVVKSDI
eukprot:COSAG02_NODE_54393_length_296_cov_0.791878_1_plen_21_part_10